MHAGRVLQGDMLKARHLEAQGLTSGPGAQFEN